MTEATWNSIFSMDNFHSYAWGCVKLYETLVQLEKEGFTTLVNPSRGAVPFIQTLDITHRFHSLNRKHSNNVLHNLQKPLSGNEIMLPFTADVPEGYVANNGISASEQIREYWVKVLKAMLVGDLRSPHLIFYQFLLTNLLGFEEGQSASIRKPTTKFVFVDTVISGRAICEIERSFISNGLHDYHLVLLLDNNGDDLKASNRLYLEKLELNGKATLIRIKSLFTEDRGPSLTATWCVSVPQLVSLGSKLIDSESSNSLIGAAVTFIRVSADNKLNNKDMTVTNGILYTLLFNLISDELLQDSPKISEYFRSDFVDKFNNRRQHNTLSPDATRHVAINSIKNNQPLALGRKPITGIESIDVSSSHVIRLNFSETVISKFLNDYKYHLNTQPIAYWYHHYD
jgi:hypothetical protein